MVQGFWLFKGAGVVLLLNKRNKEYVSSFGMQRQCGRGFPDDKGWILVVL